MKISNNKLDIGRLNKYHKIKTINLSLNKLLVKFANFHHSLLKNYYQYYGISKNFLTALWQKFIKFPLKSYLGTSLIIQ